MRWLRRRWESVDGSGLLIRRFVDAGWTQSNAQYVAVVARRRRCCCSRCGTLRGSLLVQPGPLFFLFELFVLLSSIFLLLHFGLLRFFLLPFLFFVLLLLVRVLLSFGLLCESEGVVRSGSQCVFELIGVF